MGGYLICLCCFYLILVINTTSDVDFNTIISYALNLQESNISYSYRSCIFILPEKCRGYFCKTRLYDKGNREIFFLSIFNARKPILLSITVCPRSTKKNNKKTSDFVNTTKLNLRAITVVFYYRHTIHLLSIQIHVVIEEIKYFSASLAYHHDHT